MKNFMNKLRTALIALVAAGLYGGPMVLAMNQAQISTSAQIAAQQAEEFLDAARDGDLATIKKCLGMNINVNVIDSEGWTALHFVAYNNFPVIVQVLIKAAAQLNIQDDNGRTALHLAVLNNSLVIAKTLINAGADCNVQDWDGCTALHFAIAGAPYHPSARAIVEILEKQHKLDISNDTTLNSYYHNNGTATPVEPVETKQKHQDIKGL